MVGIIVAFQNRDNAANIRNLINRSGYSVVGVGTTGAQVMQYADLVDEGIVVCGYRLGDMMYSELREYLPDNIQILLVASQDKWVNGLTDGVIGLSMPIKAYDLLNTIEMMMGTLDRRRKKRKEALRNRSSKQNETIKKAKDLLMHRNHMTEDEAHKYLQKRSMDNGTNMVETAEMVLSIMSE